MTGSNPLRPLAVVQALRESAMSAEDCVAMALRRIDEREPDLKAWVSVDRAGALAQARSQSAAPSGLLNGMSIGIKDIIDIAGQVTRGGSSTRAAAAPAQSDAWIVQALREAGAVIIGKTVTTEYAMMDPPVTRNPWHPGRTPGGSSSGSAASVASGMVSAAIGTQTAGSLCRPASYCGIGGIKPSYGLLRSDGLLPLAPSFDTLGIMAARIEDCAFILEAVMGWPQTDVIHAARIAVPRREFFADADAEALACLDKAAAAAAAAGYGVEVIDTPFAPGDIIPDHRLVMAFEAYQQHAAVHRAARGSLGRHIGGLLDYGAGIPADQAAAALERIAAWRSETWRHLQGFDAVLTLPVPASAPLSDSTGPAHYQVPWTALRGPLAALPMQLDRHGLPLACMLAAPPMQDQKLLGIAKLLGPRLHALPDRLPPL